MSEPLEKAITQTATADSKDEYLLSWKNLILFIILFLGISFGIGIILGIIGGITNNSSLLAALQGYIGLLVDAFAFIIAFLLFQSVRKFTWESLNLAPVYQLKTYLYILIALLLTYVTQFISFSVIGFEDPSNQMKVIGFHDSLSSLELFFMFLAVVLVTPIKEELLFRGILHRFLEKKYNFYVGLIVSSLLFGITHFGYPVTAMVMGVISVLLYRMTNSLYVSMIYHIIWNAFVFVTLVLNMG
ncbi:MAG TPA: type II CAAX endopeptidase family protein [Anoxybacillus sp.]|jgi:membrane protease YdiL (CAAX protease family)|nr:type II CAAX endopeptidase family protein [Anoxybacillus sp.]